MQLRRPSIPVLASIAVHMFVVAFFVQALMMQRPLFDVFGRKPAMVGPVERIGFLALPQTPNASPTPGRRGGNGQPVSPSLPQLVAPTVIPSSVPSVVPSNAAPETREGEPGTGPLIGGGGQLRGIQPRYDDPRVWVSPGAVVTAPKTSVQQLDSVISGDVSRYNDSMRVATGSRRAPGDWTVEHNGQKYGIDQKYIRLGPVSIPTAVLALLPLNITGNPSVIQRERSYNAMRNEILSHAQQGINEADFQKAVRGIRQRKERERQEQAKEKAAANAPAAPPTPASSLPASSPAP